MCLVRSADRVVGPCAVRAGGGRSVVRSLSAGTAASRQCDGRRCACVAAVCSERLRQLGGKSTWTRTTRGELRGLMNQYFCNVLDHRPRMHQYLGLLGHTSGIAKKTTCGQGCPRCIGADDYSFSGWGWPSHWLAGGCTHIPRSPCDGRRRLAGQPAASEGPRDIALVSHEEPVEDDEDDEDEREAAPLKLADFSTSNLAPR